MNYQELVELYQKTCQERDEARANYKWLADRAINEKLDGYREIGTKTAETEYKFNTLAYYILSAPVLRSSCSDSCDGEFRVHIAENKWDYILKIADNSMKINLNLKNE